MACSSTTLSDRVFAFSVEASTELSQQQDLLNKVKNEGEHQFRKIAMSLTMVLLVSLVILIYPKALVIWFIISLFLYSYNFLFLMLPTTSKGSRPKRNAFFVKPNPNHKWEALKILLHKRKLAVEMGLTLFLGRIVPLTMSFTVILGMGITTLVYLMLNAHTVAIGLTRLIILQVSLILLFYILVNILRPQAQGISAIARSWKRRLGMARFRGRAATILVELAMLGVVITSATLFIGGMILPGMTLIALLSSINVFTIFDLALAAGLFVVQMWVMRSFQCLMSRRIARKLIYVRIDKLQELLSVAENISSKEATEMERTEEFQTLLTEYYSMMIYDIFRLDFFGRAPVYLVGPRFKYILDEKALHHLP